MWNDKSFLFIKYVPFICVLAMCVLPILAYFEGKLTSIEACLIFAMTLVPLWMVVDTFSMVDSLKKQLQSTRE